MFLGCSLQIKPIEKFPLEKSSCHVYFVTCDKPEFPIKVGIATNPAKRFAGLQTGLPYPLVALGVFPGDRDTEQKMKILFFPHRLKGEWYERTDHMLTLIERWGMDQQRRLGNCFSQRRAEELDAKLEDFVRNPPYVIDKTNLIGKAA